MELRYSFKHGSHYENMKRKYAQLRDIEGEEKRVGKFYGSAVDYFSKEFGISKKDFPKLEFVSGERAEYDQVNNVILVGDEEFAFHMGDTLGEELGHYVRANLKGRVGQEFSEGEAHSDEFFGFLGSKFLYKASNESQKGDYFPEGERSFESTYEFNTYPEIRKELLDTKREKDFPGLKKQYREAEEEGDETKMQKIGKEAEKRGFGEHVKSLLHVRPYHFASETDLEKVGDLKEFYSLSDKEARNRFFRKNKRYGKEGDSLEGKVIAGFVVSLLAFFLISSRTITGNVVGEFVSQQSINLIPLAIAVLCGCFLVYRLVTFKWLQIERFK